MSTDDSASGVEPPDGAARPEGPGGFCAAHRGRRATGTCERCGAFYCADCCHLVGAADAARRVCGACAKRPDVDYLGALRSRLSGRRDLFIWMLGILGLLGSLAGLVVVLGAALAPEVPAAAGIAVLPVLYSLVVFTCYLLKQRWTRWALFTLPVVGLTSELAWGGTGPVPAPSDLVRQALIPTLLYLAAWRSPRNKLAFGLEVSRAELERLWRRSASNPLARAGYLVALLSILVPGLEVVSAGLSIAGLRRVNPRAWPPVYGRGEAIKGIVFSVVGLLGTVLLVSALF
ncbi:MAG: hypothetical protein D6729_16120 [Deltaproteobacteria bacterium]|nr:MAG: hypothetical protein D6729_16120 [Deltaproteobacteria bacterium]